MIKLMHGDCLELMKEIPDGSVDLVLTDPPYGTTNCRWDSVVPLEPMWEQLNRVTKTNSAVLIFGQTPFDKALGASNLSHLRYEIIWHKPAATGFLNANKMPLKAHENILVFYRSLPTYNPQKSTGHKPTNNFTKHTSDGSIYGKTKRGISGGGSTERHPRSVVTFSSDRQKLSLHPTQKPVALMEYLIKTYSNPGDTVLDFTMGSGTTGVACKNLDRDFIGIELDENYFNIACDRINNHQPETTK